jgi:hypothetical protein
MIMKKIISLLLGLILFVACGASRYTGVNNHEIAPDAVEVLHIIYPELVRYYDEGVLRITSMRRVETETGYDYKIKYKFVRYYYTDYTERMICLKEMFPDFYRLHLDGTIEVTSIYKYVNEYGEIRHHISYRKLYVPYYYDSAPVYYPYGRYRIYRRLTPIPPRMSPPPPPRQKPGPEPNNTRNARPRTSPGNHQTGPGNQSHPGSGNQSSVRPNNSHQSRSGQQSSVRSNSSQTSRSNSSRSSGGNGGRRR